MRRKATHSIAFWTVLPVFTVWTVVPIALVVLNSFKRAKDIFTTSPRLLFTPTLDNYVNAFTKASFGLYYLNSVIVAVASTVIVIVTGTFAAYALTSFPLRSANAIANSFFHAVRQIAIGSGTALAGDGNDRPQTVLHNHNVHVFGLQATE